MSGRNNFVSELGPQGERTWSQLPNIKLFDSEDQHGDLETEVNNYLTDLALPFLPDVAYSVVRIDYDTTQDKKKTYHSALVHINIWQPL